jgi:hypothetical protein
MSKIKMGLAYYYIRENTVFTLAFNMCLLQFILSTPCDRIMLNSVLHFIILILNDSDHMYCWLIVCITICIQSGWTTLNYWYYCNWTFNFLIKHGMQHSSELRKPQSSNLIGREHFSSIKTRLSLIRYNPLCQTCYLYRYRWFMFMVPNATFNNISVILLRVTI